MISTPSPKVKSIGKASPPELTFYIDDSLDYAETINKLLKD
jgi:ribosome-binding factor A